MSREYQRKELTADLRRSVESALDVRVSGLRLKAGRAKVDDLDPTRVQALQQDVLRLEVTVNDAVLPQHG